MAKRRRKRELRGNQKVTYYPSMLLALDTMLKAL